MPRRLAHIIAIALAGLSTAGDWPGSGRRLAEEFRDADPARRVALVAEAGAAGADESADTLRAAFNDPSEAVVLAALEAVARHRLRPLAGEVSARLGDERPAVRLGAVNAARVLRARDAMPGLLRAAGDSEVAVRVAAVGAVAALGAPGSAAALLDRVHDPESAVRVAAVRALGELGDASAALTVLGVLDDPNPDVRVAAARALGHIPDARAVEALRGALRDDVVTVRLAALRALSGVGDAADAATDDIAPMLLRAAPRLELSAREALARAALEALCALDGPRATALLARALREGREDDILRATELLRDAPVARRARLVVALRPLPSPTAAQIGLLGELGGALAADALLDGLQRAPTESIPRFLTALGRSGDARAPRVLLRQVDAPTTADARPPRCGSAGAQAGAMAGLRAYVDRVGALPPVAVDPLLAWLASQPAHCRNEIVTLLELLGATQNPRAASALLPWTRSDDARRRTAALRALGRTGGAASEALLPLLREPDDAVRLAAADVLSRHLDAAGLRALLDLLRDEAPVDRVTAVRVLTAAALRLRRVDDVVAPLAEISRAHAGGARQVREAVWDALGQLAADGSDAARGALDGAPPGDHRAVAAALGDALATASPARRASLAARTGPEVADPIAAPWNARGRPDATEALRRALGSSRAAEATNAAAALAVRSMRALPLPDGAALCEVWSEALDRGVRGNLGAALVLAGAPCEASVLRAGARPDEDPDVRLAIVTAAAARAEEPSRGALLRRCARGDAQREVSEACASLLAVGVPARGDLDLRVRDGDLERGGEGLTQVRLGDGVVVWMRPGAEGWIRLRGVARGPFRVSR